MTGHRAALPDHAGPAKNHNSRPAMRKSWSPVAWLAPTATVLLLGLAWLARLRQLRRARRVASRIR